MKLQLSNLEQRFGPQWISQAVHLAVTALLPLVIYPFWTSCAFMLPVATPPNAIVFGSE